MRIIAPTSLACSEDSDNAWKTHSSKCSINIAIMNTTFALITHREMCVIIEPYSPLPLPGLSLIFPTSTMDSSDSSCTWQHHSWFYLSVFPVSAQDFLWHPNNSFSNLQTHLGKNSGDNLLQNNTHLRQVLQSTNSQWKTNSRSILNISHRSKPNPCAFGLEL